jgi:hypothetical protein
MSERSDAVRAAHDALSGEKVVSAREFGQYNRAVKALLDEHERMEEVLAVARDFLASSGPFIASDGYVSVAMGNTAPLRDAMERFDGYRTVVPDRKRIYDDPTDV